MLKKLKLELKQILFRAGGFLKTDIIYIMRQGSWLAGGEIVNNVLGVVLIIAFANLIPASTYGIYKYILSIYGIFALFGLSGAGPAIIKSVAEGNEGIFKPALKIQIKWGVLGSLGTLLVALYYFAKGNEIFGYSFIIAAVVLPFFESLNTYQHILAGKKRFDLQTKYYSATRIISALSLILTLFLSKNILVILSAYFLPYIISNFIFGSLSLKKVVLNNKSDSRATAYIKHLSFINAVSFAVNYLDGIIIFQLLGPIQLAIFSIAFAPMTRVQSFLGIIPEISLPKYAERPIDEIKTTIVKKILKSMIVCALIVSAYIAFVPFFFKWFLPQYSESIIFAQILAVPLIWYPLALLSRVLLAKGATRYIYYYNLIESALQLVIMFTAIYFFGLMGAVMGRIAVSMAGNSLLYHYFKKL